MSLDFTTILEKAVAITKEAGEIARRYQKQALTPRYKGTSIDLVTDADREIEAFILDALRRELPNFGIIGEEGGDYVPESGARDYHWFIDPVDGTTNFAHRLPYFSIILCLVEQDNTPVLGIVYDPMRDECFTAIKGQGAFLNEEPIHVSETPELLGSLVVTGFPYDRHTNPDNNLREFQAVMVRVQGGRRLGSAGLDLAQVACGRVDGFWELRLNPWDCLAGILLVQEAGGKVTDYSGSTESLSHAKINVIATNGRIQGELTAIIQSVRETIS